MNRTVKLLVVWIMWTRTWVATAEPLWEPQDTFPTKENCVSAVVQTIDRIINTSPDFKRVNDISYEQPNNVLVNGLCFPDTFDPREKRQ